MTYKIKQKQRYEPIELPIYKIKKKGYFYRDERLREYRNVFNPHDRISFDFVNNEDLVKSNPKMSAFLHKKGVF